jgi:hypothetical protein
MIGDGLWGSVRRKGDKAQYGVDPSTGNVVWLGIVYDHDAPAFYGMRLRVQGGLISEVETVVARKGNPGSFGDPAQFVVDAAFDESAAKPLSRKRLQSLADAYLSAHSAAQRRENGVQITGEDLKPERVRARRFPVIDAERGLVVAQAFVDFDAADGKAALPGNAYPRAREAFEILKVGADGKVARVEAVSVFQSYGMPSPWTAR